MASCTGTPILMKVCATGPVARDYAGFKTATAGKPSQVLSKSIQSTMQINQLCVGRAAALQSSLTVSSQC